MSDFQVIPVDSLPAGDASHELSGRADVSLIFVDTPPGGGPSLHRHPYQEVFILQEGEATFTVAEERQVVTAGHVVVVPAGVPHAFVNSGSGRMRQLNIHVSPEFDTEWL